MPETDPIDDGCEPVPPRFDEGEEEWPGPWPAPRPREAAARSHRSSDSGGGSRQGDSGKPRPSDDPPLARRKRAFRRGGLR